MAEGLCCFDTSREQETFSRVLASLAGLPESYSLVTFSGLCRLWCYLAMEEGEEIAGPSSQAPSRISLKTTIMKLQLRQSSPLHMSPEYKTLQMILGLT
ncbi:hypothetical protein NDU88_001616 [Pleurodeles waltl]|uniref:Uncharacterized protein n=1 Tax=Pleurodeles waltl TaxID=8319 RepID=A0AAV7WMA5_PLEWA|nr:hypothetical protein NDU88_001616 [Pleurodeles waltl]